MGRVVDAILGLSGVPAYTIVGLLAFAEAAAFIGLLVPGEVAALLGGVIASSGHASYPVMLVLVSVAAVLGDSAGYELGRRYGARMLAWPPFERRFGEKADAASAYLRDKGGRAVFLGRWTSVLRALVPGLAGMARMPYGRFLAFNLMGGVAWGCTFVTLGYLAGSSWRRVEKIAGQASLVLLGLIVSVLFMRWLTARLVAHADAVQAWLLRLGRTRPLRWVGTHFGAQLRFIRARTTPGATRGLGWTASFLGIGLATWVLGIAIQDLFAREELALLDRPVAAWFNLHSTPAADRVSRAVVRVASPPVGVVFTGLAVWVAARMAGRSAAILVVVAAASADLLAFGLRGQFPLSSIGTPFPSLAVAHVTATMAALLPAIATRSFVGAIRVAGVGVIALTITAVADLVVGGAALSGVVGAVALGVALALGVEFTARSVATDDTASHQPSSTT